MRLLSEKGSITIFSILILSVVITSILALTLLVQKKVNKGICQDSAVISSRALLSEYNKYILDEYGLLVLNKDNRYLSEAMEFYMIENTSNRWNINANVNKGNYIASNVDNMEKEIVDYQKVAAIKNIVADKGDISPPRDRYRILKNSFIVDNLPSEGENSSFAGLKELADFISNIDEAFDRTLNKVLIDDYILSKCNNNLRDNSKTFFRNEVEYILAGSKDDEKNYKRFRRKLKFLRNIINIAIIESTPSMKAKVTAAAGLTGPFAGFSYLGLLEAWALAESENDVEILEHGGKIPIKKDEKTWAIDLDSISNISDGYIDNKATTGMDYEDYLRAFLFFTSKEKKINRLMDIIQINTRGNNDRQFSFSGSSFGIEFNIEVEGQLYEWQEKY